MTESEFSEELFRDMLRLLKSHMGEKFEPVFSRLYALEKRLPERGEKGADGINGKDGAPGLSIKGDTGDKGEPGKDGKDGAPGAKGNDGAAGKDGAPGKAGKDGEPGPPGEKGKDGEKGADGLSGKDGSPGIDGKDGHPGIDGKNADPEFTKQLIVSMLPESVQKAFEGLTEKMDASLDLIRREALDYVKALPLAPAGKDGKDADPEVILRMVKEVHSLTPPPKDGRDAPSLDELALILEAQVEKRVALIPIPKDGRDGRDAPTLEDFRPMLEGEVAKAAALIPPGRDGRDATGKDGKDGFGFEDLRVEYDGERSFALVFERGAERKEFPFQMPVILDRGVYESAKTYERGDSFTYGGALFITQRRNMPGEKPGDDSGAFRLSVKRGRDGKDGA